MPRTIFFCLIFFVLLSGFGCANGEPGVRPMSPESLRDPNAESELVEEPDVLLPLNVDGATGYETRYKRFGEYVSDRFRGYHTGEDAEGPSENLTGNGDVVPVPVRAVADGTVVYFSRVSGYGGVIILQHEIDGEAIQTLYGHLALSSSSLKTGDAVAKGQFLANLGADTSRDTDGERQHLHFAVYPGTEVRLQGYVSSPEELSAWINPFDFFTEHRAYLAGSALPDPNGDWISSDELYYPEPPRRDVALARTAYGNLSFSLPPDWDVEYIPSVDALNLYVVSGTGPARERSQILIRYFDANQFETLSTVDVLSTEKTTVGQGDYEARTYLIQKRAGVADFADQPSWRNQAHVVTDFRAKPNGFSRFYVVAANPDLDEETYAKILESMRVTEE